MSADKYSYPAAWDEQEEWFKRMIDDFPDSYMSIHFTENVEAWFEKWLSQFRNNKE